MVLVGLTGGIGSGKSSVSRALAERGAVIIDADLIARDVVAPGGAAYAPLVERFGPDVLADDGTVDRAALAHIVFRDPAARAHLEAITHPAIGRVMADRIAEHAATDAVVVLDIPLLTDKGRMGVEAVIVVDCPEDLAIERLVRYRGFELGDAQRRVASQLSREDRLKLADVVIDNAGSRDELLHEVARVWDWLMARRRAEPDEAGRARAPRA